MQPTRLDPDEPDPSSRTTTLRWAAVAFAVGGLITLAAVYGIGGLSGNAPTAEKTCDAAPARARRLERFFTGEVAAFRPARTGHDLSALAFDADGRPRAALSQWKGRVVLLNVWATWCPPCRAEMPSLDRLQARRAHHDFEVVAVAVDKNGPAGPKAFLRDLGARALRDYADPTNAIAKRLKTLGLLSGLPTTVLIDRTGCALGTVVGAAEWDAAAAVDLIDAAIALKP